MRPPEQGIRPPGKEMRPPPDGDASRPPPRGGGGAASPPPLHILPRIDHTDPLRPPRVTVCAGGRGALPRNLCPQLPHNLFPPAHAPHNLFSYRSLAEGTLPGLRRGRGAAQLPAAHPGRGGGVGFRVQGSGCRVQGSGFRFRGTEFRVQGPGFRVQGGGGTGGCCRHSSPPPPPSRYSPSGDTTLCKVTGALTPQPQNP